MKAILGIASLLIVLAIVGFVAKSPLQAVSATTSSDAAGASAATPAQAQALTKQVQQDVENALRQGAAEARASEAIQ